MKTYTPAAGAATSYQYAPDGNRVSKTTTGATAVSYLVDSANPTGYPQVLAEVMAGRRMISASRTEMPLDLDAVVIGAATAAEIRWLE